MSLFFFLIAGAVGGAAQNQAPAAAVDLSGYDPAAGILVKQDKHQLRVSWPAGRAGSGFLVLNLRPEEPLVDEVGLTRVEGGAPLTLLRGVNPVTLVTVGVRDLKPQGWNVFFDNPLRRPHETFRAVLPIRKVLRS